MVSPKPSTVDDSNDSGNPIGIVSAAASSLAGTGVGSGSGVFVGCSGSLPQAETTANSINAISGAAKGQNS